MIADTQLRRWIEFLDHQSTIFEAGILSLTGSVHVPTAQNVAFLAVDDELMTDRINTLVEKFAAQNLWEAQNEREWLHLLHRGHASRGLLLAWLSGQIRQDTIVPKPPNADDNAAFVSWLFLDLWRRGGRAYINALTDYWLAHNPRS